MENLITYVRQRPLYKVNIHLWHSTPTFLEHTGFCIIKYSITTLYHSLYGMLVHHRVTLWVSVMAGAYNPEHATPILSLGHSIFTDQSIFRQVLDYYFSLRFRFRSAKVCIPPKWQPSMVCFLLKCLIYNARRNMRLIINYAKLVIG